MLKQRKSTKPRLCEHDAMKMFFIERLLQHMKSSLRHKVVPINNLLYL